MTIIRIVDSIPLTQEDTLTILEQYAVAHKWYVGYNSYWSDDDYPLLHSFFLDIDNRSLEMVKSVLSLLRTYTPMSFIGVILKSSENHYHIVVPTRHTWPSVVYQYAQIVDLLQSQSILGYMINCVSRHFSTLRLSKKTHDDNQLEMVHLETKSVLDKPCLINYYHWSWLKVIAHYQKNQNIDRDFLAKLNNIQRQKWVTIVKKTVTSNIITHYSDK